MGPATGIKLNGVPGAKSGPINLNGLTHEKLTPFGSSGGSTDTTYRLTDRLSKVAFENNDGIYASEGWCRCHPCAHPRLAGISW